MAWLFVLLVIVTFDIAGVRPTKLSRDALQQLRQPFYLGMISNFGVLAWCSAAALPLFASFHLTTREAVSFLRWIGTLTLLLMFDDLLMLHEQVLPTYLHLPEETLYAVYFAYMCLFLSKFWRFILTHTHYKILVLAFALFGVSIAIELNILPGGIDVEDWFKIMGIVTYAYYCIATASGLLSKSRNDASDSSPLQHPTQ